MTSSPGCAQNNANIAELERGVVGAVLSGTAVPSQLGITPGELTDPLCRRLLAVCADMEKDRVPIDFAGVCMCAQGIDEAGAVDVLQRACISPVFVERNVGMLRDAALERAFRAALAEAMNGQGDALGRIAALRDRLSDMLKKSPSGELPGVNMLFEILHRIGEINDSQGAVKAEPVATGIAALDKCLCGGFRPGDLGVVAALTSVGKSAMLSFMMRNAAAEGKKILFISCEMSDEQNAERYMAAMSGIPLEEIISRREPFTQKQNEALSDGMNLYNPGGIQMISSGSQTPMTIRRAATQMKYACGLDLIVVDYLQRLHSDRPGGTRAEEIGSITAALKSLAVDMNVPVLTAAQFNREAARGRAESSGSEDIGVPALHQLRDSSQIEDEANTVIVLDEPRRMQGNIRHINAIVSKNRSGGLGRIRLNFNGATMRYTTR